jgi:hypothetical protein
MAQRLSDRPLNDLIGFATVEPSAQKGSPHTAKRQPRDSSVPGDPQTPEGGRQMVCAEGPSVLPVGVAQRHGVGELSVLRTTHKTWIRKTLWSDSASVPRSRATLPLQANDRSTNPMIRQPLLTVTGSSQQSVVIKAHTLS